MTQSAVTVIGLGSMGMGMAQVLLDAGIDVRGVDVSETRLAAFEAAGGKRAALGEAAAESDVVFCVVLNAAQTEAVLSECLPQMRAGACFVSCATVPPDFARQMEAKAADAGMLYLDAPISGGAVGAESGTLSIMASGSAEAFDVASAALEAVSKVVYRLGDSAGAGSAMKAVNQLLAGVHLTAMGEALTFAASQGLDLKEVVEIITNSAGNSWMFANRAPRVVEADYEPRSMVDIWPKDLGIVCDIASGTKVPLPLTEVALRQYRKASEAGDGAIDDAAITRVYARAAGVKLPGDD